MTTTAPMPTKPTTPVRRTALWVLATVVSSALVFPASGFVVAWISTLRRFCARSPSVWLLLLIAAAILAIQMYVVFGPVGIDHLTGPVTGVT